MTNIETQNNLSGEQVIDHYNPPEYFLASNAFYSARIINEYLKTYFRMHNEGILPPSNSPDAASIKNDPTGNNDTMIDISTSSTYLANMGMGDLIQQIKLQKLFNNDLLVIFVIINIIVIFIFVKRRVDDSKKQVATLKALG
jgi:hypothetical protein